MSDSPKKESHPPKESPEVFSDEHIDHLADLISNDDSPADPETGTFPSPDLDDTGRFHPPQS